MDQGVGHRVKRLREGRNWSQAKLAVEADMSVSGVSMIENGQRNLTTTTLGKLARAFGVEVADLFPKAQAPLQLDLEERRGAPENLYTDHEATGRILASNWQEAAEEWGKEIPAEGLMSDIKIGRLLGWTMEIDHTLGVYRTIAQDSGDAQREEMQDTLKLMEKALSEALKTTRKALDPAITLKKFRQMWEADDLGAIMSEVEDR